MDKKEKVKQALKLAQAIKEGGSEFVIMEKLDKLEDMISGRPEYKTQEPKDEEITIELEIV